ncbi:beta-glucosidase [Flavobacterium sp. MAH-1]|uniref:Beta-glucosidase n=1 Tax=Flavobacterium agri TaxID=2743471 RepID=A0A7Y8Y488_9FLAO|nr:glucoamylase family protein [Flavobacterium agri]NUY82213.1 beta-glucosidase [Flavobacterium agri]NYA72237.1 beta-glucosidase [Flavobacterium agri]
MNKFFCILVATFLSCSSSDAPSGQSPTEPTNPGTPLTDAQLLDLVEKQTFKYFWDYAEANSGMARERYIPSDPSYDQNIVTTGGSGFGLMAILAGINQNYITRTQGLARLNQIADFLNTADRFHGAWPHWMNGTNGDVIPFGTMDNGGDLVETAFLASGMITVREFFKNGTAEEQALATKYDNLWKGIDWDWYRNGQNVLYWHWSPNYGWQMNFPLQGYNECLITYVLAASSPTHGITAEPYHQGWGRSGQITSSASYFGFPLILKHNGAEASSGPLFWAHYSYLGLDPNQLNDQYANYWDVNYNHSMIHYNYCVANPNQYNGYGANYWGLTASYSRNNDGTIGYDAHMPSNDKGVISPTAAISSIVYTPTQSMAAMRNFYENYGTQLWGPAGFYDAHSKHFNWTAPRYLAIDQGPEIVMIENYRTGLLWSLFMNAPEVRQGLQTLGFHSSKYGI